MNVEIKEGLTFGVVGKGVVCSTQQLGDFQVTIVDGKPFGATKEIEDLYYAFREYMWAKGEFERIYASMKAAK